MNKPSLTLLLALMAKSIAETCFVATLALAFFFKVFPPYFHGWGEATPTAIAGWVVDDGNPWERVRVQLYIDGNFVADGIANLSRRDVQDVGWSKDEWHGFAFAVPPLNRGFHEARVYALHTPINSPFQTQQLVGNSIFFTVDKTGTLTEIAQKTP